MGPGVLLVPRQLRTGPQTGTGDAELALVQPEVVVVLGATAGKALFGSSFRVTEERGALIEQDVHGRRQRVVATIHPSAVLRADDRETVRKGLVSDLRVAAGALRTS